MKKKSRKSNSLQKPGSEEHVLRVHLLFYNTSRRNFESFCLKMPKRCVVYGCSNVADTKKGISIYQIPFWNDNSPVAVRRRKRWLSLCSTQSRRRDKWIQLVCSKHFTEECFVYGSESVEKYNTPRLQ